MQFLQEVERISLEVFDMVKVERDLEWGKPNRALGKWNDGPATNGQLQEVEIGRKRSNLNLKGEHSRACYFFFQHEDFLDSLEISCSWKRRLKLGAVHDKGYIAMTTTCLSNHPFVGFATVLIFVRRMSWKRRVHGVRDGVSASLQQARANDLHIAVYPGLLL